MKKNNKKSMWLIIFIIVIIIGIVIIMNSLNLKNKNNESTSENNLIEENVQKEENETQEQENIINEIKEKQGLKADNNLYEVNTEYDGRKVLNIKASVEYKVAFAGIIKQSAPTMQEIDKIINENYPKEKGVWVSKQSREGFLNILKENTNSEYEIDEEGYLKIKNKNQQNDNDKKIENLIKNKKIIITISSMYYEIDNVTGEIVEYPFEKLDNYQTYDQIRNNDDLIIVITSNKNKKITNQEILKEILENIN